jgi:hypothetical protein
MNADELMKIQQNVGGDVTKTLSTIDVLSSLKAINYFTDTNNKVEPTVKSIADNELKYLSRAMKAISESPALSIKFGNGFEGALGVASLLKQRVGEQYYNAILDPYAKDIGNKEMDGLLQGEQTDRLINLGQRSDR